MVRPDSPFVFVAGGNVSRLPDHVPEDKYKLYRALIDAAAPEVELKGGMKLPHTSTWHDPGFRYQLR